MHRRRLFLWGSLAALCLGVTAAAQRVDELKPIMLRSGAGLTRLKLTNNTGNSLPLDLKVGPVLDAETGVKIAGPTVSFALEPGEKPLGGPAPALLDPGKSADLVVNVSNLTGTSVATMKLFNQNTWLADVDAVELDDPLNVTIDGMGAATVTPLGVTNGRRATLVMKNSAAESLALECVLEVNGVDVPLGTADLPPNGSRPLTFTFPVNAYRMVDWLQPTADVGQLHLAMKVPNGVPGQLVPVKVLPVDLTMMGASTNWTTILSLIYVGFFLAIGGGLSILASAVLPNMVRKFELRGQLREAMKRIASVSTRVDSYLRVLLRLESKRVDDQLAELHWYSFTTTEQFTEAAAAIAALLKRLTVAERLDSLRRRFEDASATAPPSISDAIDKTLDRAAGQLHSLVLPDDDVDAANAYLTKAEADLELLEDADGQARVIAANFAGMKERLSKFNEAYYTDLRAALPGIFDIAFDPKNDFSDPKNIFPPMFFAIDHAVAAMQTTLNYAMVRASIPKGASANCQAPGTDALTRLKQRECELLNLLGTLSWKSLHGAITLVQQMREDIYDEDVLTQIEQKRARIVFDTQRARPNTPVYLSIAFDDPRFNGAAALNWLAIRWRFPNGLTELGWKVCHYFEGREASEGTDKRSIEVSAQSPRIGKESVFSTALELQSTRPPKEYSAAIAGLVRFLIAFGVALAGLKSGALDQLSKLGFIQATLAIVALGFGADAVKNLLTQSPGPQAAAKSGP